MIMELDFEDEKPKDSYVVSEFAQRTDEWFQERLGCITASNASKIITTTGAPSKQSDVYMNQLIAELEAGKPVDVFEPTQAMQNGIDREDEARELYSFITNNAVQEVGLIYKDKRKIAGASVDGLIGDDGIIEIKCPKASTLIGYRLKNVVPSAYFQQIQMQLWVTGRKWAVFFAFHPDIKHFMIKTNRDQDFIDALQRNVEAFNKKMFEKRKLLS